MNRLGRLLTCLVFGAAVLTAGRGASAAPVDESEIKSRTEMTPKRLQGVDVEEHLERQFPETLGFTTDEGRPVVLGELFSGELPVIVTMNYSDCPMLCSLQLNGLIEGLKKVDLTLGKDYRMVTVSLNPSETVQRAHGTKTRYLAQYGRPEADPSAWTVLIGSEVNIRAVADTIGIRYNYNEKRKEYVHPAAFVVTSPGGKIERYVYGIEFQPKTLRLSLIEASQGKVGSSIDRLVLYCFHYDETEGRYAPVAMNIMRLGSGVGAVALSGLIGFLWWAERKKQRGRSTGSHSNSSLEERTAQ
jgi:protein SCO1/2